MSENKANWDYKKTTYEYDKKGNLIKKNMPYSTFLSYKYDAENRLTVIKDNERLLFSALYDGNGDRIFTVTNKENTGNWHDDGNNGKWQPLSGENLYDDGKWTGDTTQAEPAPTYDDGSWQAEPVPTYDDGSWKPEKYNSVSYSSGKLLHL